mmetsp:Transcript_14749/g.41762  ORF Transcript_14749/g.41762 Transcript_14749/m.41762 type:complete len:584 (+) Transcript_14749:1747-3498(+)
MPHASDGWALFMRSVLLQNSRLLPIPKVDFAVAVSASHESSIRTECDVASVAGNIVTTELLLLLDGEFATSLQHGDVVVKRLCRDEVARRVHRHARHGMHGWVGNVLDGDADIPLPHQHLLVVAACHHLRSLIFHEHDRVDRRQVVVVLLRDFAGRAIVRHDPVVAVSNDEEVVILWIKFHDVRDLAVCECLQHLAGFGAPQSKVPVKRSGNETAAVVVELDVADGSRVPLVRSHQLLGVDVVNVALSIQPAAQQQMARLWEQADALHSLVVLGKAMHALLGHEALVIVHVGTVPVHDRCKPGRRRDPRLSLVIGRVLSKELGLWLHRTVLGYFGREQMGHLALHETLEGRSALLLFALDSLLTIALRQVRALGQLLRCQAVGTEASNICDGIVGSQAFLLGRRAPNSVLHLVVGTKDERLLLFDFGHLRPLSPGVLLFLELFQALRGVPQRGPGDCLVVRADRLSRVLESHALLGEVGPVELVVGVQLAGLLGRLGGIKHLRSLHRLHRQRRIIRILANDQLAHVLPPRHDGHRRRSIESSAFDPRHHGRLGGCGGCRLLGCNSRVVVARIRIVRADQVHLL